MSVVGQMLYAHPDDPEGVGGKVRAAVEACGLCAQVCVVCAKAYRACSRACQDLLDAL
ncbi:hypothetical protein [Nocardiopsis sp. NPDC006832]|uniref:hypothetical protein n=1 Tax=Nocardiopsis sp. NPDC006832 TaxID=3157188 RepID=UPI00340BAA3F